MMRKFLFKITLFILLLINLIILVGEPLTKINPGKLFVNEFESSLNNNPDYDIFFFGSSKCFGTYNPRIFKEEIDVLSFNFGSDAQRLPTTEFFITEILGKSKPKLVVIDVYYQTLLSPPINQPEILSYQYAAYDSFDFSLNKLFSVVNNYPIKEIPAIFFKGIRNHKGWKTIATNHIDLQNTAYLKEEDKGYRGWQFVVSESDSYLPLLPAKELKSVDYNLSEEQLGNLQELLLKLKEINIPILFVTAPSLIELKNPSHAKFSYALKKIIEEKKYSYLDLNSKVDEIGLSPKDFRDKTHLNNKGGNKVSSYFAKWVNNNYNIGKLNFQEVSVNNFIKDGHFDSKSKKIDYALTDEINVIGVDFIKNSINQMSFIMEIKSNNIESLQNYNIMLHAVPQDKYINFLSKRSIEKGGRFEIWDFKPDLVEINKKYYLIKKIDTRIEKLKYINLGVYDANGYNGLLFGSNKIDFSQELIKSKSISTEKYNK